MSDIVQYATHRNNVDRWLNGTECELEVGADWPYDCVAKDQASPESVVIVCHNHKVWWHEETTDWVGAA